MQYNLIFPRGEHELLTPFIPSLELLLRAHINDLEWRIGQLNHMPWFECFGVYIVHIVWVKDARTVAV